MTRQQQNLMTSQAQTSSEFAILLAVLLVILGILITSFTPFPSFGNSKQDTLLQSYWNEQDVAIIQVIEDIENYSITIKNTLPVEITLTKFQINDQSANFNQVLRPGNTFIFIIPKPTTNTDTTITYLDSRNVEEYTIQGPGVHIMK